jgi:hypothetical protein
MRLRTDIEETDLSVNWLEHCVGTRNQRLKAVVAFHRAKFRSPLSPKSGVAVLNAERIRDIGDAHGHRLRVRSTPSPQDLSYSQVSGLPLDNSDENLISSLAEEAFKDFMLLSEVDALR